MSDPVARLEKLLSAASPLPWKCHQYYWGSRCRDAQGQDFHLSENGNLAFIEAAVNALPALLRVAKAAQRYRELIPTEPDDDESDEYVKWDKDIWEVEEELDAALDALKETT